MEGGTRNKLFQAKIVIAKNLLKHSSDELIEKTGLTKNEVDKILEEVKVVCDIK